MKRTGSQLHDLAGAYALDAVSDAERRRFERHLGRCEACAEEIRGYREVAARLGSAATVPPPPAMRSDLLSRLDDVRQFGPGIEGHSPPARLGLAVGAKAPIWTRVAAVVLAALALSFGALLWTGNGGPSNVSPSKPDPQVAAVLTAPDAVMLEAAITGGGRATIVLSRHEQELVFSGSGMPVLPEPKAYVLWLIRPSGDVMTSRIPPAVHGMTGPVVASGLRKGDRLGLSVEPITGSHAPTSPMLLEIAV